MNDQERELDLMVAELEQENRLLRARNDRLQAENKELEAQVESINTCNRNLFDALNAARGEVSRLRDRLSTYVAHDPRQVPFLRKENDELRNRSMDLQDKLLSVELEYGEYKKKVLDTLVAHNQQVEHLRKENTALREKLNTPGKSREHLTDEIKHLQAENTKLRGWVWDAEQAAGRLQIEVREKKDAIRALNLRITALEGEKK